MRLNNFFKSIPLFLRVWIIHCVCYYFMFGLCFKVASFSYQGFPMDNLNYVLDSYVYPAVFGSVIGGIIGFFEGIPGFVLIPMLIMYLLLNFVFKDDYFKTYVCSLLVSYSLLIAYTYYVNKVGMTFWSRYTNGYVSVSSLFFIVPLLSLTIIINRLVFKKEYKKQVII